MYQPRRPAIHTHAGRDLDLNFQRLAPGRHRCTEGETASRLASCWVCVPPRAKTCPQCKPFMFLSTNGSARGDGREAAKLVSRIQRFDGGWLGRRRQRRGSASPSDESQSFVRLLRCVMWPGRVLLFIIWSLLTPLLLSELCFCTGLRLRRNWKMCRTIWLHSMSVYRVQASNKNLSEYKARQFYSVAACSYFILIVSSFDICPPTQLGEVNWLHPGQLMKLFESESKRFHWEAVTRLPII